MQEVIKIILLAVIGGVLYRMGGSWRFHTLWRDIGTSLCIVSVLALSGIHDWTLLASFALLWAAMTTYLDFVNKWFGKTQKEFWVNWFLIGITYTLALLPSVIVHGLWKGFYVRMAVLALLFVVSDFLIEWYDTNVKKLKDHAVQKEFFRGFLTVYTTPLLFI